MYERRATALNVAVMDTKAVLFTAFVSLNERAFMERLDFYTIDLDYIDF
ncbi:MAG: hypothetical protein LBK66_01805 [Spirochaetaceae bacterium]|jgi:hypothetical protein|nr:hypothetical protein [Spirochaetaceae bacterium]